jgi:integrase
VTPTIDEYLPRVLAACPPTCRTYRKGLARFAARYGARPLTDVTALDLRTQRDEIHHAVGHDRVQAARRRGRRLRSTSPRSHGQGAAENYVRAVRFFFECARLDGLVAASPAKDVPVPRRLPPPERALTAGELGELFAVARLGDDPDLDVLIVLLLRHTAARRQGLLDLTLDALSQPGRAVLTEKYGVIRDVPLHPSLAEQALALAHARGARHPEDGVLRYRDEHPLTSRRLDTLFDRLDAHTTWSEPLEVAAHWIRHTTLTDIEAVAGPRVAAAYAGHAADSVGVIGRYVSVDFEDLQAAYLAVFGPDPGRC